MSRYGLEWNLTTQAWWKINEDVYARVQGCRQSIFVRFSSCSDVWFWLVGTFVARCSFTAFNIVPVIIDIISFRIDSLFTLLHDGIMMEPVAGEHDGNVDDHRSVSFWWLSACVWLLRSAVTIFCTYLWWNVVIASLMCMCRRIWVVERSQRKEQGCAWGTQSYTKWTCCFPSDHAYHSLHMCFHRSVRPSWDIIQ